jgi:hypothetical protein
VNEYLRDSDLRTAGFKPTGSVTTSVAGWTGTAYEYSLPGTSLLVLDDGRYVPLANGTLTVYGVPDTAFAGGIEPLIGPNVLQQGARLNSSGLSFALTPACPTP